MKGRELGSRKDVQSLELKFQSVKEGGRRWKKVGDEKLKLENRKAEEAAGQGGARLSQGRVA